MTGSFFWFAIFPMILGGIILAIFIFFLKRTGEKTPENPETERITPARLIKEVAQFSNTEYSEAEKIIEFVFSYFPGFSWRSNLPRATDVRVDKSSEEKAKKNTVRRK